MKVLPRYPVYIPTKGRAKQFLTARMFEADGVDFRVVVEPNEVERYAEWAGRLLVMPENDRGLVYARNWIKDYSKSRGEERHWQFDDDIEYASRILKGYRIRCDSNVALAAAEDFADRYENVALLSFNSEFFLPCNGGTLSSQRWPPFYRNARCYTCFLVLNSLPNRWRQRYNEDTDMSLQVLADGWCTVLINAFMIKTKTTMSSGGGQTPIYVNDGRLKMSRQLERVWPGVVTTRRRFGRPQHYVKDHWEKFDTPLRLKPGVDLSKLGPNEYGLRLKAMVAPRSETMRELLESERRR